MRWAIIVLIVGLVALTSFFGLRLGYLSLTPVWMYNAQGQNVYSYQLADTSGSLKLMGTCTTRSGAATFLLFRPDGTRIDGQECVKGKYSLNLQAKGTPGFYKLQVLLDHFTGRLEIAEDRSGPGFQP